MSPDYAVLDGLRLDLEAATKAALAAADFDRVDRLVEQMDAVARVMDRYLRA